MPDLRRKVIGPHPYTAQLEVRDTDVVLSHSPTVSGPGIEREREREWESGREGERGREREVQHDRKREQKREEKETEALFSVLCAVCSHCNERIKNTMAFPYAHAQRIHNTCNNIIVATSQMCNTSRLNDRCGML